MGYYDAYDAILSVTITPRDRNVDITKRAITYTFKNNPSYYQVQRYSPLSPEFPSPIDAWIIDDPTKTKEVKQIQLIPDQVLNYGDMISWLGKFWITTIVDYMGGIYYRGSIQKCYSSLQWLDSLGIVRGAWFAVTKDTMHGLGISDGKIMILPNERRFITIQNNIDTLKITKGQRFILDNDRCFRVTSMNTLMTGLIQLEMEEQGLNPTLDNVGLRIANYILPVAPPIIPVGTLYIYSNTSPINKIKVTQSKVYLSLISSVLTPVNWEVYDVNKTGITTLVSINSFDNTSCILKANSSSLYGSVQLKATLQSDATKFYWLQIDVVGLI